MRALLLVCVGVAGTLVTLFTLDYSFWGRAQDEIHLLPDGYEGAVVIVFNRPDGQPAEYEKGKRVYRIPPNGILKTQFAEKVGTSKWRSAEYFYVKADGSRSPITYDSMSKLPNDDNRVEIQTNSVGTGEAKKRDGSGNVFHRYAVAKNRNAALALKRLSEINVGDI